AARNRYRDAVADRRCVLAAIQYQRTAAAELFIWVTFGCQPSPLGDHRDDVCPHFSIFRQRCAGRTEWTSKRGRLYGLSRRDMRAYTGIYAYMPVDIQEEAAMTPR